MDNCLETRLKKDLAGNGLVTLGALQIKVHAGTNSKYLNFGCSAPVVAKVVSGNGHIGESENDITHTEITYSAIANNNMWFESADYVVEIQSKYGIYKISALYQNNTAWGIDLNSLAFNPIISQIWIRGPYNSGDIKSVADCPGIYIVADPSNYDNDIHGDIACFAGKNIAGVTSAKMFVIKNSKNVFGDIANLNVSDVKTFDISHTNISGDIKDVTLAIASPAVLFVDDTNVGGTLESLASKLAQVYGNNEKLTIHALSSNMTYNGEPITATKEVTFIGGGEYVVN